MKKTVALGISDFKKIIEDEVFYVDKTYFLKEWIDNRDYVTLITRPRRFGKTLTMSMVEYFLSDRHKEDRYLFENLYIGKCDNSDEYMKLQGSAPVIFLSFAGLKGESFRLNFREIESRISDLYLQYRYILDSDCLTAEEKEYYYKISSQKGDVVDLSRSIMNLSYYLERYSNKKVYILLDEYDTPMQNAYVKGYWDEIVSFMMAFFVNTFKNNNALNRAIITGITRVSKESIFSDFNNLETVTTTSKKYASCFGFTEEEVTLALDDYNLSDEKEKVRVYYNGFVMGGVNIYNPWSILNFLQKREYDNYWANTSSNALIGEVMMRGSSYVKADIETLLQGKSIDVQVKEDVVFSQLETEPDVAIWGLLLSTGYLKVLKRKDKTYTLALTNMEILDLFEDLIKSWFATQKSNYNNFIIAMLTGNYRKMERYLNNVSMSMFSYFDTGSKVSEYTEPERFYHGFVLGLMVDMKDNYVVESNRESGLGRYDVCVIPKNSENNPGIIIEFKVYEDYEESGLDDTVNNALKQIDEKNYEQKLKDIGVTTIYKYGIAFRGKECKIGCNGFIAN